MSYAGMSEHIRLDELPDPTGKLRLEVIIGEGTYGEVYKAFDLLNGQYVAVKIMESIGDNIEEIEEEYLILRDLCLHPNIPTFYGLYLKRGKRREEDQLWFAMELCSAGSVTDLVHGMKSRGRRLDEVTIAYILRETIEAMVYLHRNHCMHRDLKGHNILLTEDASIKLIDYGVSSHTASTLGRKNTSVGTPYWMAPEVIACEQQLDYSYDIRCDVWSLGITAIELADGDPPLSDVHPMRALFQIPRNPPPKLQKPTDWSGQFNDFIATCLVKDFERRPFARLLLNHPFIAQLPPNAFEAKEALQKAVILHSELGPELQRRSPEMTTKKGQLKVSRCTRLQKIYCDDLASLENFTADSIVKQLEQRYRNDIIYTYIGDILLSINPFSDIGIYSEKEVDLYRNRAKSENPPHVFAMADSAYHTMLHQKQSQCIIISGESGSGKTVTANLLLKQLVTLGKAPNRDLEKKILIISPIIEAFGNARTGINDNSSRFGKHLDVTFTNRGMISGAKMSVYLLEQSRVVRQAPGEKNFHIFQYLIDGLGATNKLRDYHLDLSRKDHHNYISPNITFTDEHKRKNVEKFHSVQKGFQKLGFTTDEIESIYSIIAAIIHLGDLQFIHADSRDNTERCILKNPKQVEPICKLLRVNASQIMDALTAVSVVTHGEIITRNNSLEEAEETRDAMAKGLYGRLFDWIVNQINRHLSFGRLIYGEPLSIGVLDIFGFENFRRNSFEQLCINIANEQIQFFFNQHIFSWEQEEYKAEGIDISHVEYIDNRPVLDMFLAKPLGLLALLDEESRFPGASAASLIEKFQQNVKTSDYIRPKSDQCIFSIRHYAGKVTYDASLFLEKNRNFLPPEVVEVFRQSDNSIVQFLFQCPLTKTGNLFSKGPYGTPTGTPKMGRKAQNAVPPNPFLMSSKKAFNTKGLASQSRSQQTVATYFRYSLMDLLQKMIAGTPHFIRCIKPNDSGKAKEWNREKVMQQLQYTGILETVRIRKQGFSHRMTFAEFLRRYVFLAFGYEERVVADKPSCEMLLERMKLDGWAVGHTKVFLKYYHVEYLAKLYEQQVKRIIQVQSVVRRWLAKVHKQKIAERRKITEGAKRGVLQSIFGKKNQIQQIVSAKQESKRENAAVMIQKHVRGFVVRCKYNALLERRRSSRKLSLIADDDQTDKQTQDKQKMELDNFASRVFRLNHENQKNQRKSQNGIQLMEIGREPENYSRPEGFKIVPRMLNRHEARDLSTISITEDMVLKPLTRQHR